MFRVCHVFLSVHCSLVVTCWERADLLSLSYVRFYFVCVTIPCGVLGQVLCLIVSIAGPEVIMLVSCSTQLSMKFNVLINVKCQQSLAF